MKVIIKIDKYFPDTNSISARITKLNSDKPIDEIPPKMFDCSNLCMDDAESFIESLAIKLFHRIEKQESSTPILDENQPVDITGDLDFNKLIGKVLQTRITNGVKTIKMRRVEL